MEQNWLTFTSWAPKHRFNISKDKISDISELPPAFGRLLILCPPSDRSMFCIFLKEWSSKILWTTPPAALSFISFSKWNHWRSLTEKLEPTYMLIGLGGDLDRVLRPTLFTLIGEESSALVWNFVEALFLEKRRTLRGVAVVLYGTTLLPWDWTIFTFFMLRPVLRGVRPWQGCWSVSSCGRWRITFWPGTCIPVRTVWCWPWSCSGWPWNPSSCPVRTMHRWPATKLMVCCCHSCWSRRNSDLKIFEFECLTLFKT